MRASLGIATARGALLAVTVWAAPACLVGDGYVDVGGDAAGAVSPDAAGGTAGVGAAGGAGGTGGGTTAGAGGGGTGGAAGAATGGTSAGTGGAACVEAECAGHCCVSAACGWLTEGGCQGQPPAACAASCFEGGGCCLEVTGGCGVPGAAGRCIAGSSTDGGACDLSACDPGWGAERCCQPGGPCGRNLSNVCTDVPCAASLCFGACCLASGLCGWLDAGGVCSSAPGGLPGDALQCSLAACPHVPGVHRCCRDATTCGYRYGITCAPAPVCAPAACDEGGFDCCVTAAGPCGYTQGDGSCGAAPGACSGALCGVADGCCPAGCSAPLDPDCACPPGRADCDGQPANGCEVDVLSNATHCGACNQGCLFPSAAALCVQGACALGACVAGRGDCDGQPANGCEAVVTGTGCPGCGNGVVDAGEDCDTAITSGTGLCPPGPAACNDGVVCTADAVTSPGTCAARCVHTPIVTCGAGEGCCPAGCTPASDTDCASVCGNGTTEAGEGCDGGPANSDAPNALCRLNCQPARCGDGILDPVRGEVCDDTNGVGGDGCSATCQPEAGYVCTGSPSACTPCAAACCDGLDNDGDGAADHPADPGCASPTDPSERGTVACDDGVDNDVDGQTDYPADTGCTDLTDQSEQ